MLCIFNTTTRAYNTIAWFTTGFKPSSAQRYYDFIDLMFLVSPITITEDHPPHPDDFNLATFVDF